MRNAFAESLPGLFDGILLDEEEPESADPATGSGRRAAQLPGDAGYLLLDGPGAGRVVSRKPRGDVIDAASLPTRDTALDSGLPLFIVHRGHAYGTALPRLLAQIHAAAGPNVALGIACELSQANEQALRDFNAGCQAAAVRIIDPVCFRDGAQQDVRVKTASARAKRHAPYLDDAPATTADILTMQRARGANLLLTAGRTLDPAEHQRSLDQACSDGDDALAALQPGERLALNLTMSGSWLTSKSLREALLAQLLDQQQFDTWYVRVQWHNALSHAQPTRKDLLDGYQELAQMAADENRRLLLPQTGLTGWLMLAFGAAGFGTGISGSYQAFQESRDGGGGGGKRVERYFERQLLHTIERTASTALARLPGYLACRCPYCAALSGGGWSEQHAGLHYLFNAGTLTAETAAAVAGRGGTHGAIRHKVRSAHGYAEDKPLTGSNVPRHLEFWGRAL